jgi:hypothetical protein
MTNHDGTLHAFMRAAGSPINSANARVCWNLECARAGHLVTLFNCDECGHRTESARDHLEHR